MKNCAVNRVVTQHNQDDWEAIRRMPISEVKRKVHRRYPQAMKKRKGNIIGGLPPKKWRKISQNLKVEGGRKVLILPKREDKEFPRAPVPAFRRPNITLEAWGNLDVNERLMYHQYPKTVRDVLLLPNIQKEGECPPGTYMHIWSAGQIKSLLLDSGKLGQSKTSIIKYLEPLV